MKYREIGTEPQHRRKVSALALGAMLFGTVVEEERAFAVLDRYVAAGGTFLDTANNYAFWINGTQGGESEALLGRWRRSRGITDEVVIATKLAGRPKKPGRDFFNLEGLAPQVIRESSARSRELLGVEKLDLLYAHGDDMTVPQRDVVEAFAGLVRDGTVDMIGVSNHWSWRLERWRATAEAANLPSYSVIQYHHTYLRARGDVPGRRSKDGDQGLFSAELITYLRDRPELTLVAYTPLLSGAYVREDRPLGELHDHAGTKARLRALHEVVRQTGATANQVVLSWMIGGDLPVIPLVGASSVEQLDESLEAVDLELTADQRALLDAAH
ncbi:aldo/keto reductase [Saccharothrix coeruleofusca]|uniref:Oxidoreductase n=1 Tax=Saccharothrix coeruleofusca TaxID=33919 RepID=A0A918AUR7_9PSEU|nr:aldo/keto reductase [Saccharothrix coeruleofusca]MBP2335569.1 aryl-alcohol dehydrogenase-like predicted oxidoreductase [Saccharothrix coeruleofusca]GGP79680.1 oxidoreductase [Saccharothrix coeruleofusca]